MSRKKSSSLTRWIIGTIIALIAAGGSIVKVLEYINKPDLNGSCTVTKDTNSTEGTTSGSVGGGDPNKKPPKVYHPVMGTYRLREERWEPDGSLWQDINEEKPGAVLSIRMDSKESGRCQLDSSVGMKLGQVHVKDGTVTIEIDENQISKVSSVDKSKLVLIRHEKDIEKKYVVTSIWERLKNAPFPPVIRTTPPSYTLFIRKLVCLKSMYQADVVSLVLGVSIKWTGEIRSGNEMPLGIEEEFTNAETVQLMIWDYGSTVESVRRKAGRCHESREETISRRKADQGEQVINLRWNRGGADAYDYELVYEVVENR